MGTMSRILTAGGWSSVSDEGLHILKGIEEAHRPDNLALLGPVREVGEVLEDEPR